MNSTGKGSCSTRAGIAMRASGNADCVRERVFLLIQKELVSTEFGKRATSGRQSEMQGAMIVSYANGDRFEGEFSANTMNGPGFMSYKNGAKYEGSWKDGVRDGTGVLTDPSGARYQGEWKRNLQHGKGTNV